MTPNPVTGPWGTAATIQESSAGRDINLTVVGGDYHVPGEVTFPIIHLPPANPHFVGRSEHLEQLTTGSGQTTITQTISGLGGVGKSQLLLHYAHRQRDAYDIIWWLRVDEALAEDLLALGRQLRLPVDTPGMEQAAAVQLVRNWLNGSDQRWLLLCDNADKTDPRDLRTYLPTNPQGRILISSRNPHWRGLGEVLRLDVFTPNEATAFWQERLNQPAGLAQSRRLVQSELDQLAEELGYLPLALEHAAAYIDQNQASAADYLRLFQTRRRELWANTEPPDDYHATIATTWDIGFAEARRTPGAADLLHLCCFLAPAEIPLDLLVDHAEALPDELAAILADPLARNAALTALERYALLTRSDGLLTLHRLVQTVARDRLEAEETRIWAEAAIQLALAIWPFDQYDATTWIKAGELLPHLRQVSDLVEMHQLVTEKAATLNGHIDFYLGYFGNLADAKPYSERALAIREKALGSDLHNEALLQATARSLNNLGALLQTMGDLAAARPYYERALAIREKALGPDHPDTASSLNNLGALLDSLGDLAAARPYYERALAIWEKALGPDHPDTALSLNNLGALLRAMGDLAAARPYYDRALAIYEKALGPDHPDTALSLNNLGYLLRAMGDLAAARPYYDRALAIREKALGPDHPDTAYSYNNLGTLCYVEGDFAAAVDYLQKALANFERVLGAEHPNTQTVRQNLAAVKAKL